MWSVIWHVISGIIHSWCDIARKFKIVYINYTISLRVYYKMRKADSGTIPIWLLKIHIISRSFWPEKQETIKFMGATLKKNTDLDVQYEKSQGFRSHAVVLKKQNPCCLVLCLILFLFSSSDFWFSVLLMLWSPHQCLFLSKGTGGS